MELSDPQRTGLIDYCEQFAKQMIEDSGDFYPFGADIGLSGELTAAGFWTGDEQPEPQELYEYAINVMRQKAVGAEILGAAIAANVNVPPHFKSEFTDGIRVHVEARGFAQFIYLPYRVSQTGLFKKSEK